MVRITEETVQPFEEKHRNELCSLGAECTLFLKKDGTLPWKETKKIALFGSGARNTIKGGTGSGDVNVRHFTTIEESLKNSGISITTKEWMNQYEDLKVGSYNNFTKQVREEAKELGISPVMYGLGKAMPEPEYEFSLDYEGDAAIYVLSRNSGEGSDRSQIAGDIELSETEIRDILLLNNKYEKFVLVLNVGGMVNLESVKEVKNILLLSQLGMVTGDVLANLITGKSYPSGKLSMTWAPLKEYSTTEGFGDMDDTYYREGVYVGYRYFDSVKKTPAYPFGYGLSYTDFVIEPSGFEANEKEIRVVVSVTNIGGFPGKEVVQVYYTAPDGKIDKPYQELAGFAKTKELLPGNSQNLTIAFETKTMASYDVDKMAYIMEKGDYIIRVGNSSRNTVIGGVVRLDKTVCTEKTRNICPEWDFEDFKPEQERVDEAYENKTVINIDSKTLDCHINTYAEDPTELQSTEPCTWKDVVTGEKSMDSFVGSLTLDQLAYLNIGAFREEGGMESQVGAAAISIAGGAGETTLKLKEIEVPSLTMADGPAGLRLCTKYKIVNGKVKGMDSPLANYMDFMEPEEIQAMMETMPKPSQEELEAPVNYVYCTAIPIGTALAQSWSEKVCQKCGDIVGSEMELFGIHLWLAPALNIQRSPLCGRDFEYYSEDPLASGKMAAAVTKGVQIHKGCAATIKHFACNNQETNRMLSNSIVSERALREIYLKGFEICVKEAQPHAVMSSYNLINGEHTCNSKDLLTHVLRDEWGFQGIVMTDWYAANDIMTAANERKNKHMVGSPSGCVKAGNDIVMPGMVSDKAQILESLEKNSGEYPLNKAELQQTAKRVLTLIKKLT